MRNAARILNIAMIAFVFYNVAKSGIPKGSDVWIVLLISLTPIVNLLALRGSDKKTWIGLFFERKRLEEERRIQKIRSEQ